MTQPSRRTVKPTKIRETERDFQNAVIDLARTRNWLVHHCRPAAMRSGKWATPIQGDAGFPDLVLAKNKRLIFAELKRSQSSPVSEAQLAWIAALRSVVRVCIWTPEHWEDVERALL